MFRKKGYVVDVFMIENIEDLMQVAFENGKIYQHPVILELIPCNADLDGKIMPVQFLALSLVADEPVRRGK